MFIYYSSGSGGGTDLQGGSDTWTENNQINFQQIYDANSGNQFHPSFGDISIDGLFSTTEHKSLTILSFDQRQKGFKASNENIEEVDDLDKFLNDIDGYEGVEGTPLEKSDSRESPFDVLKNLKPWNKGQENKGQQCDHIWELVDYGEPQQLKCQNCSRTFYSSDPNAPF